MANQKHHRTTGVQKFGGSAWRWHAESEQYYLHLFAPEQADLNWENPAVRAELKKSL
ncbi:alpha-amylase family glycosyl hydrolase [Escherichia coli]